jgi:hypothetical protein
MTLDAMKSTHMDREEIHALIYDLHSSCAVLLGPKIMGSM